MATPTGTLADGTVTVADAREASTLYNKGYFGVPRSGGGLDLDLAEATYLAEAGRLTVTADGARVAPADLFVRAARAEPGFEVRYVVYRDLRQRTLVVRSSNITDFNVYATGGVPGRSPSKELVRAASERSTFDAAALLAEAARSADLKKRLVVAVVDEEGDLTYYHADLVDPRGSGAGAAAGPQEATAHGYALADRVVVADAEAAQALATRHFGRRVGATLQLGFTEALFLAASGDLDVVDAVTDAALDAAALAERARAVHDDFDRLLATFQDLRARGLVVKTGFKFGTHYRCYRRGPDDEHAPLLVHALAEDARLPWPEVAGFVRLAHGVKKDVLFAIGDAYLRLRRTKP